MIKINLLSTEKKEIGGGAGMEGAPAGEQAEGQFSKPAMIAAGAVALGIIGFMFITQSQELSRKEQKLRDSRARKKQLDEVLKTIADLEKATKMLDRKVKLISDLKSSQQDTVKMMDSLCDALPEWVWITSLGFSSKKISLAGKAFNNNLISDFINNLEGTGSFYDINFPGSTRARVAGVEIFNFKLSCSYKDKYVTRKAAAKPATKKKKAPRRRKR